MNNNFKEARHRGGVYIFGKNFFYIYLKFYGSPVSFTKTAKKSLNMWEKSSHKSYIVIFDNFENSKGPRTH